jgi:hypothetical protein
MAGWNCTPSKAPLVPKTRLVLPLPENTRRIDLGFPPPSHAHLNRQVPTRNEELPRPQLYPDDFRNVLRKKHAGGRRLLAGMPVAVRANYPCRSMNYSPAPRGQCERRCFHGNPAHSLAMSARRFSACFRAFCLSNRRRHASRFRRLRVPRPGLRKARGFRRCEGGSNKAIQLVRRRANHSALNPLSFVRASRNGHVKPLDLFTAGREAHFKFKAIVVRGIRFGPIERDQDWKFSRQALLDIGRFECRAAHGDSTMLGPNGQADRGQRTGCAVGAHAGIDTETHLAPGRRFDFAIKRRGLRVASARRAQHSTRVRCFRGPLQGDRGPHGFVVAFTNARKKLDSHTDVTIAA